MTINISAFPPYKFCQIAALVPYARNARTHSDAQVAQIAASIREFGFTNPILVDAEGGVIAGHGRLLAARKLGMTEVPTLELAHLTPAQRRAYVLADNRLALSAGWDDDLLRIELTDLQAEGFNLELTGFDLGEIAGYLADPTAGLTDPDDIPPAPEAPVSCLGDVWLLGRHRLVCGDSTTVESVDKALAGVKPHLMVTDPPYGVEYDASWRSAENGINSKGSVTRTGAVANDSRADWREAWALFPGNIAYVWHGGLHSQVVSESLIAADFKMRSQIIWAKQKLVFGRGDYHWQHEPCWYAVRGTGNWMGDRKQSTVWSIDNLNHASSQEKQNERTNHSTQKPVECMKRPIENNSSPGQAIYEPFSGSGTTIIACEMTGRSCHAIELSPAYVDVAVLRWQTFTGQAATLEGEGSTFATLATARSPAAA